MTETDVLALAVALLFAAVVLQALAIGSLFVRCDALLRRIKVADAQAVGAVGTATDALRLVQSLAEETGKATGALTQALAVDSARVGALERLVTTADRTLVRVMSDAARMTRES